MTSLKRLRMKRYPNAPDLKQAQQFRIIGTSVPDADLHDIVYGQQLYSIDLKLPEMLYAVVTRSPVSDGQPVSFEAEKARAVPGVVDIVTLKNTDYGGRILLPNSPNFVSGVAVIATGTWAAMKAARLLEVEWELPVLPRRLNATDAAFRQARRYGKAQPFVQTVTWKRRKPPQTAASM